jgi:hypothetical protein
LKTRFKKRASFFIKEVLEQDKSIEFTVLESREVRNLRFSVL